LIAGREVKLGLLKQQAGDIIVCDHVVKPPSGKGKKFPLVPYATCMMKQLADRDHLAEIVYRKVFAHVVVQRQFSILDEQVDREGRKLLGDRG
jgi:hypothetical protein